MNEDSPIRAILRVTEERVQIERDIFNEISALKTIVKALGDSVMSDIEQNEALKRVHARMDDLHEMIVRQNDVLRDLSEKVTAIDVTTGYQDRTIIQEEGRRYLEQRHLLPILGILTAVGTVGLVLLGIFGKRMFE